ncbi:MAG: apolipoprotein N-acyltransferase [Acidimicrobiales bacterium]
MNPPGQPANLTRTGGTGRVPRLRAFVRSYGSPFLAGLLLTSGLPPFGWWPLALVGASVMAATMQQRTWPDRFRRASAVGLGFLGPGLFWITEFHLVGFVLGVAIETLFLAAVISLAPTAPAPLRSTRAPSSPAWMLLTLPASLVLVDASRSAWPFGGTPIALFSQTQIGGPLAQVARLGGGLAVTAMVGVVGVVGVCLAALTTRRTGADRPKAAGPAVAGLGTAVVIGVCLAATFAPNGRSIGDIRVSMVQGGGERGTRAVTTDSRDVVRAHVTASAKVPKGVDLVLWPEDVLENDGALDGSDMDRGMGALARRFDAPLAAGVFEVYDRHNRNAAVAWDAKGVVTGRYEKNQRVPFGEYVPFRSLIASIVDVSAIPNDAIAGKGPAILRTSAADLGVVICYEVFFSRRTRAAMDEGAELLYVPTNANSYTTTQMPALELGAARLRAIETGRYVLQVAPTGFSAFIDPDGDVVSRTDLGAQAVLTDQVQRRTGSTLYTRTGDGPIVVLALLIVATARLNRPRGARLGLPTPQVGRLDA